MANVEIDGRIYVLRKGENLLQACLEQGLNLPYFCWHPALGSVGACRQCAVVQYQNAEDARGRITMACMTPVTEGLRISLQKAEEFRAGIVELLMTNHPHDCPVCEEGGECHLQDMTEMTGHTSRQYRGKKRTHRNQDLGPFINHEMNRCIACYRCVRYYRDYCGGHDLQVFASHNHVYFGRHEDGTLENEFSGNLVEVCPTGVFTDKTFRRHYTRKWDIQTAPSVCPHCALGCNTSPGERYGTLRRIVNRYHGEINGYFLCDRGRFGYEFVNGERRIRQSILRNQPPLGMKGLANVFLSLLGKSKGVIGIGSPRASLESNFALRKLVGPDYFFLGIADAEYAMMAAILDLLRQAPVHIVSLREAEQADAVFILGEDVSNTSPRLALSLRQAARNEAFKLAEGQKIPRWNDAAARCAGQSHKSPLFVASFAPTRLDDVAASTYRAGPDEVAQLGHAVADRLNSKVSSELDNELDELASTIAEALKSAQKPLLVCGTGCQSLEIIEAAGNIAVSLAANREGKPAGVHFVVPECNSFGLAMMGGQPLSKAFEAVEKGETETVVVLENDLYRRAEKPQVEGFLSRAGHVVLIDHLLHETARQAEVALAAATYAESEGTWVSSEGRAQRFYAVMPPSDEIQESWHWLAMALGEAPSGIDELTRECAGELSVFSGIVNAAPAAGFRVNGQKIPRQPHRYSGRTAMLADKRIHEPKQTEDGQSALAFSMEGAASHHPPALNPFVWAPGWNSCQSVNKFQEEIGGHLKGGDPGVRLIEPNTTMTQIKLALPLPEGKVATEQPFAIGGQAKGDMLKGLRLVPLHHVFGSEELSMLSGPLAQRAPAPYLALNPDDAEALGISSGATVKLQAQALQVLLLPGLARGLAGVPYGLPGIEWVDYGNAYWEPEENP